MARNLFNFMSKCNIARPICAHLVGKDHDARHRVAVGFVIMIVGVVVAKTFGHNEALVVAIVGDAIGYGLHGIGLIPVVELIADAEI